MEFGTGELYADGSRIGEPMNVTVDLASGPSETRISWTCKTCGGFGVIRPKTGVFDLDAAAAHHRLLYPYCPNSTEK
jgi:hypothetical protein